MTSGFADAMTGQTFEASGIAPFAEPVAENFLSNPD
jgi:hypothetical protein